MAEKTFDSVKIFKIILIVYLVIFIAAGVFAAIFGISLDINFKGGTRISYSYTGDIDEAKVADAAKEVLDAKFTVSLNKSLAGDTKTVTISLVGKKSLPAETQESLTTKLTETFKDNKIELYDSNSVSPSVAGVFFAKSLVAVLITAVLVVVYIGIRFRKIGGVSAAVTALCALVLDLLITFAACIIFRLQIDSNDIAVVLTILGYSLNDTIVVYDRIRENRKLLPTAEIHDLVNISTTQSMTRSFRTTITTVATMIIISIVAYMRGVTSILSFSIPISVGMIVGTYSSLCLAPSLWVSMQKAKKSA